MAALDEVVKDVMARDKKFQGLKLPGASFKGLDLRGANFRGADVHCADFSEADLTYANFENANCAAAVFRDSNCHRTNFKDASLSCCVMEPSDLYGATVTLECKSFQGMKIAPGWWWGWIFYGLLMQPPSKDAEEKLIALMGVERYATLRKSYVRRQI